MGEFVRLEVADGIGTIRLDRPKVNALNDQLTAELMAAAQEAEASGEVRAVIIYGGERVFAAGADINDMAEANYAAMADRSGRLQAALSLVAAIPTPVVAAITGYALGGGLELALAAEPGPAVASPGTSAAPDASGSSGAPAASSVVRYSGEVPLDRPGPFGYTVRVLPWHPLLDSRAELGLVTYPQAPTGMTNGDLR